jgi:hypothetical protein
MIVARWQIDALFGHKAEVIDSVEKWQKEIGARIGWTEDRCRMMTGSVGVNESTVVLEVTLDSMTELDDSWNELANIKAHKQWSKDLEPYIVSGSHRWEIYRQT